MKKIGLALGGGTFIGMASLLATPAFSPAVAQSANTPPVAFKRCAICHTTNGKSSLGPHLNGVVGRKAGAVPGYTYSKAMAAKSIKWDERTLDTFLAKPQSVVPGTKMAFAGMTNEQERKQLIAYLAKLK